MAARALNAAVAAAQDVIDSMPLASNETTLSYNLDDLEMTDALFDAQNNYFV